MRVDLSRRFNPGLCKERIYIQQKTEGVQNSFGVPAVTWSTYQEARARVMPMAGKGGEIALGQQTFAEARIRVETAFVAGVTREMRIVWGNLDAEGNPAADARVLNILDVENPYQNGLQLHYYCKEWVE